MIPTSYKAVTVRCVLPPEPETDEMGLAFVLASGEILRMRLSVADARWMNKAIAGYLPPSNEGTQSERSSGSPNVLGSTPDEGQKL